MTFDLQNSISILKRTPSVLKSMLIDLPKEWTHTNEGPNTWSPYDVIGHLIHGEKTDWMVRNRVILSDVKDKTFVPFDRWAQMNQSHPSTISELLTEFDQLRQQNLKNLMHMELHADDLSKTGVHPELG